MMGKENRILKLLLCFSFCTLLSGCWDRVEPKNIALVSSSLLDIRDNGNYHITVEIVKPTAQGSAKDGPGEKKSNIIYSSVSELQSITESAQSITQSVDKSLFSNHAQVRFLSDKVARTDIAPVFDYLLRSFHLDEKPLIVVVRDKKPQTIYACEIGLSSTVGDYIESMSRSQPAVTSKSVFVNARQFVKDYYREGRQPVAGVVEFIPNDPLEAISSGGSDSGGGGSGGGDQASQSEKYKIRYEGLAAFKGDQLVGYLNGVETRAYNYVKNNIRTSLLTLPLEKGYTAFMVDHSKSKTQVAIENGQIKITTTIKVALAALENGGELDITQPDSIKMLEKRINKQLEDEIVAAIRKTQTEFRSDIFGFGIYVHSRYPKEWQELRKDWDEHYAGANVRVIVDSSIERTGQIKQTLREREGEK